MPCNYWRVGADYWKVSRQFASTLIDAGVLVAPDVTGKYKDIYILGGGNGKGQ